MKRSQAREKVMGAVPPKESKPSPEQITVFMNKVVTLMLEEPRRR